MEWTFEVNLDPPSLQKISGIKVATQIITAAKRKHTSCSSIKHETQFLKIAMINVKRLYLPSFLQEMLERLMASIHRELVGWYDQFYRHFIGTWPVVTQWGKVDHVASIKLLLENKRLDVYFRFVLACAYCLEQQIWDLREQLSDHDQKRLMDEDGHLGLLDNSLKMIPLASSWNYVHDHFHGFASLRHVGYDMLLKVALAENGTEAAILYLLDGASVRAARKCVFEEISYRSRNLRKRYSPPLLRRLFMKLSKSQQQQTMGSYVQLMLFALFKPPYVRYFLEFARHFISYIDPTAYWKLIKGLVREAPVSDSDLDYRGTIIGFWKLGEEEDRNYIANVREPKFWYILSTILKTKDQILVNFVLSKMPEWFAETLLVDFGQHSICLSLMFGREFYLLEQFIRCCARHDCDMLLRLKDEACKINHEYLLNLDCGYKYLSVPEKLKEDEWKSLRLQLFEIVDKVIKLLTESNADQ